MHDEPSKVVIPRCGIVAHMIGSVVLFFSRWKAVGTLPTTPKCVIIAAPHTTNWDAVHMIAIAWKLRLKVSFLGKLSLFKWPFGWIVKRLGGVPIDRAGKLGIVNQVAEQFESRDSLFLAVAPSGTRSKRDRWKSGFYHIAHSAKVPIVCGFLDYKRKVGGLGPTVDASGTIKETMDQMRAFFSGVTGKYPEATSTVVLREELEGYESEPVRAEPAEPEPSPKKVSNG